MTGHDVERVYRCRIGVSSPFGRCLFLGSPITGDCAFFPQPHSLGPRLILVVLSAHFKSVHLFVRDQFQMCWPLYYFLINILFFYAERKQFHCSPLVSTGIDINVMKITLKYKIVGIHVNDIVWDVHLQVIHLDTFLVPFLKDFIIGFMKDRVRPYL
jgi:hypothetical protein